MIRVVVCDDSAPLRMLVRRTLELSDRLEVVAEAQDGLEAIDRVREHRPDVVLLDLSMPRLDGLEALPRLLQASPGSRVVVLSGFAEEAMRDSALAQGAVRYVEKGVDPDELIALVEQVGAG